MSLFLQLLEELVPDTGLLRWREVPIVYHGMDPSDKGIVELADPVRGQEQDATVIFDNTKED